MKMRNIVTVKLWGLVVGYLGYVGDQTEVTTFEYDEEFALNNLSIAHKLQLPKKQFVFDDISKRTFKGLSGIFADSLPDKYGNQLIDIFMAEKGIPESRITSLDRLMYVGNRSMGALEYEPMEKFDDDNNLALDMNMLKELSQIVLHHKEDLHEKLENSTTRSSALALIRTGSSAGGARAKALIARNSAGDIFDGTRTYEGDYTYWLLKFDIDENKDRDREDPKGMTRVEYIYGLLAKECGIDMPKVDYIEEKNDFHFLIERFDRVLNNNNKISKVHYASWAGLAHAHRDEVGAYGYEQLVMLARELKVGEGDVKEIFRRAMYNVIGRNQDDHTKNFGFVMDKSGVWSLSKAFDMTFSYDPTGKWTKVHQIRLNGKQDGFTEEDLLSFATLCNVKKKEAIKIIEKTQEVFYKFKTYALEFNVSNELSEFVLQNIRCVIKQ
jgi:serine/threonine-protein kinase HipA